MNFQELKASIDNRHPFVFKGMIEGIEKCEEIVKDAIDKIERAVKSNPSIHGFDNAALIALAKVNEELFGDVK